VLWERMNVKGWCTMVDKTNSPIRIGSMNLRIPGGSAETGRRVANGMAENLAHELPAGTRGHIGALSVRVPIAAGASEGETGDAIAGAIARALTKRYRSSGSGS